MWATVLCLAITVGLTPACKAAGACGVARPHSLPDPRLPDFTSCNADRFRVVDDVLSTNGEWLDWNGFIHRFLLNPEYALHPVITAEVSSVPCAAKGCCNMLMSFRPNTTDSKVFQQVYQTKFFSPIYNQLHKAQPKYILDGGGNVGYAATLFAMIYPDAQIITVEPDKHNFAINKMNTHRFPNVHAVNAGLWDKQTYIDLMASEGGEWGMMFKEVQEGHPGAVFGTTITHLMRRFRFPRIDFAKIDIEGAESRVFSSKSDLAWLEHTKVLSLELHDWMAHYYGLREVSSTVHETMSARPFTKVSDGEHDFYIHTTVDSVGSARV